MGSKILTPWCLINFINSILDLPKTVKKIGCPMGGVVLIWHSYMPESFFWGYFILRDQFSECGSCIASNRWSLVYVYLPAVRRCMSRCRIQDTCKFVNHLNPSTIQRHGTISELNYWICISSNIIIKKLF